MSAINPEMMREPQSAPIRRRRGHRPGRRRGGLLAYLFLAAMSLLYVAPLVGMVVASLHASVRVDAPFSVAPYGDLIQRYGHELGVSVRVTVATILINLMLTIPAAYGLSRLHFRGRDLLLSALTAALFIPPVIFGLALLLAYGLVFKDLVDTLGGLILAMVVGTYPLMLLPLITVLRGIPPVYEEAGLVLGASRIRVFLRVTLPLMAPGIVAGVLLTFIIVWNEFLVTLFVAGTNITAPLLLYNRIAFSGIQPSTAALAVFLQTTSFVAIAVFTLAVNRRYAGRAAR